MIKKYRSPEYNYNFNTETGFFVRWGKTLAEDPRFSPFGPEILDLEISINGCPNKCPMCYKDNTNKLPTNMSFETFKLILDKMPDTLTQIAFGITGIQTNPDFIKMLKYTKEKGIIPNFTLSGIDLTDEIAKEVVNYIGACAVSAYESNKNICYNTVKKFTDLGIKQTNIHLFTSKESKDFVYEVLNDTLIDERLKNLNAVVLLKCKPKGRAANNFHVLTTNEYNDLVNFCLKNNIRYGFDSCSTPDFENAIAINKEMSLKQKSDLLMMSESCESFGLFSSYIDVYGNYYPCSFATGEGEWIEGLSVINCNNFLKDIWFNEKVNKYRNISLNTCYKSGCRKCLIFDINPKDYEI